MKVKSFLFGIAMLSVVTMSAGVTKPEEPITNKTTVKERGNKMSDEEKEARIERLKTRANEIKSMDISKLTKDEKKKLRKEVKAMKKEASSFDARDVALGILGTSLAGVLILLALV